jgi:tRNA nucleotidyltransferase (CCA-adding enzyme)
VQRLDLKKLGPKALALIKRAGALAGECGLEAFLVGGAVRDLLLGRPSFDLDIVVQGDGISFARALAEKVSGKVRTYPQFGTAAVTFKNGDKLDVVTARRESYRCPGALPDVRPGTMAEDLFRRDFTINAIAASIMPSGFGDLRDDHGGMADLRKGAIRILHGRSFLDDPTRILRAVRYEARFAFSIDRDTLGALKEALAGGCFETITPVRYWNEFRRILEEAAPLGALKRLSALGALRFFGSDHRAAGLIQRVTDLARGYRKVPDRPDARMWRAHCAALLVGRSHQEAEKLLTSLSVGRDDKRKVLEILQIAELPVMLDKRVFERLFQEVDIR